MMNRAPDPQKNPSAWTHAEVEAALPAYLLGALEPAEQRAVTAFLQRDRMLQQRATQLQTVAVDMLAFAPEPVAPPPEITHRILARASAAVQSRPHRAQTRRQSGRLSGVRSWWRLNMAPLAVGAAAAMLLLLTGVYVQRIQEQMTGLQERFSALQSQYSALQEDNVQLQEINETLRTRMLAQDAQFASFTNADALLPLNGTDDAPGAAAIFARSGQQATLIAVDLPSLDTEQTFQLWLIPEDGAPISAGLLAAQASTPASWTTDLPLVNGEFAFVGLSIEPMGGSDTPTGPIVLLGPAT